MSWTMLTDATLPGQHAAMQLMRPCRAFMVVPLAGGSAQPSPSVSTATPASSTSIDPAATLQASGPGEPWIVYGWLTDPPGLGLCLVRPDGAARHRVLCDLPARLAHPDWSPDGHQIAYPAWSPDSSELAYVRIDHADATGSSADRLWIEVLNRATGKRRVVARTPPVGAEYVECVAPNG
jgi:hypothetical protein